MKKILFYTDTPQIGGAELQIFLLAKFLNKEKFTPILAVSNYRALDDWCDDFKREGIKVIRMQVSHKHDPRHYFQLKKILRDEQIDILHVHIWNPASCRYAFSAGSSAKIPIITTEHDPFKLNPLKDLFKKRTLRKISRIIAISNHNKKIIGDLYPGHKDKISVIHNGIDTIWWQSQLLRLSDDDYRKIKTETFYANPDSLIIMTVAELHERKGHRYLLEAMAELVKVYPNIKLVLIGDGPERSRLVALTKGLHLENHVTFLGRRKKIAKLMNCADIFVLPSRREAFGLVNLEAMAASLPIIATNTGGIPEIVEDGATGILVEPENSEKLQKALDIIISRPDIAQKMGTAGHERLISYFSAEKMAKTYEKIYDEIA